MAHVFISYSHKDQDLAALLDIKLKDAGFETWIDSEQLKGGEKWRNKINTAIRSSSVMIVVITDSAKQSEFVNYEWSFALGAEIDLLPLFLIEEPELPSTIREIQGVDFKNGARPWQLVIDALRNLGANGAKNNGQKLIDLGFENIGEPIYNVENLISKLGSDDLDEAYDARDKLEAIGLGTSSALISSLSRSDRRANSHAVHLLGIFKSGEAVEPIIQILLNNDEFMLREEAAEALGKINDKLAENALIEALKDDFVGVRREAATALGNLQSQKAVKDLMRLLYDVENVRKSAADALGKIKDKSAVQAIIDTCLSHTSARVRVAGVEALGHIGDSIAVSALVPMLNDNENWLKVAERDREELIEAGITPETTPELFQDNPHNQVNTHVADALVRIGTPEALQAVETWRKEHNRFKR